MDAKGKSTKQVLASRATRGQAAALPDDFATATGQSQDVTAAKEEAILRGNDTEVLFVGLSPANRGLLKDYFEAAQVPAERQEFLEERGRPFVAVFLALATESPSRDKLDAVLTLMDQLVTTPAQPSDHAAFEPCSLFAPEWAPYLMRTLQETSTVDYSSMKASSILAHLLKAGRADAQLDTYMNWLLTQIHLLTLPKDDLDTVHTTQLVPLLSALKVVLKTPRTPQSDSAQSHPHYKFAQHQHGRSSLVSIFSKETISKNQQVVYLAGFCVWLLSFNDALIPVLKQRVDDNTQSVATALVDCIKSSNREKVLRICLSVIYNVLTRGGSEAAAAPAAADAQDGKDEEKTKQASVEGLERKAGDGMQQSTNFAFAEAMIVLGLHKTIDILMTKQAEFKDRDMIQNMEFIQNKLRYVLRQLSSFDRYAAEVNNGKLELNSPVHTEDFWKENFNKFSAQQYSLIAQVISFLEKIDVATLQMACFDLGEFARYHPDGRRVIARLGGKAKLMALITHSDENVQKQALLSVQKIMLTNWEQLSKAAKSGLGNQKTR